ncbi:PAS domain-containing sensor histidine kinase [Terriglobus saanensis]|uniref:histidine kinase n=1 Tax=Terriglobus saanensis (strain ATCC BAA-1853 / DSM 23119 / SP1PR4) TaxID=401053 RepID=E8V8Q8_TERSS|nr:PAS domain-containing sensor histidine kinase [Terriglobus saanensis]ADV84095.1 PAS/PAC sensor signal transduction histidine kinase [Terriglobus saanensis SP1PR4]
MIPNPDRRSSSATDAALREKLAEAVASETRALTQLEHAHHAIEARDKSVAVSDERSRQLLRANPFGILIGGLDGSVGYVNPPLLSLLGYAQEEIDNPAFTWRTITPPEFEEVDRKAIETLLATGSCPAYYKEYIARDGHRIPILIGAALIPNLEGGRDFAAFVTDLSQLRRTEEQLAESRALLEKQYAEMEVLYRTAPIGLAYFDPKDFRYLRLNDAQAEIVGKPKEEILGHSVTEIAPIQGLREMFEQVASGQPVVNQLLEGELPERPGEKRAWTVNYFPVFSPQGEVQGITAASLEITAQKRAESALRQNEKLAAVGRLASSISHEINNPLEAITNLLYLARHEENSEKRNSYLETAEREVARVSQIATQTLRFHRRPGKPTHLTASDLIEPVLALYAGRLTNSSIRIKRSYRSKDAFPCMEGDMRQVINNLIGNAIDAMRSGGTLHVRSANLVDHLTGQHSMRITFSDSGIGMSPETMQRLFEAFYTTKGASGTGLGMWISKEIIDKHGGRLAIHSSASGSRRGTTFQLYLPTTCVAI